MIIDQLVLCCSVKIVAVKNPISFEIEASCDFGFDYFMKNVTFYCRKRLFWLGDVWEFWASGDSLLLVNLICLISRADPNPRLVGEVIIPRLRSFFEIRIRAAEVIWRSPILILSGTRIMFSKHICYDIFSRRNKCGK